jgi:toxin YhaV
LRRRATHQRITDRRAQGRVKTAQAGARSPGVRYASHFALTGPLRRYGRLKGLGLPDRYRLFFRPFEAEGRRLLLILWLGFPRKDGDRNDCYAVFSRLVQRGELPEDWESLQRELDAG